MNNRDDDYEDSGDDDDDSDFKLVLLLDVIPTSEAHERE
jgi:hypothetical protein